MLEGRRYITAGIKLDDFPPNGVSQLKLFNDGQPRVNSAQLMKVLDDINARAEESVVCRIAS